MRLPKTLLAFLLVGLPAAAHPRKPPAHQPPGSSPRPPVADDGRHCEHTSDALERQHRADSDNSRVLDDTLRRLHLTRVPMQITESNDGSLFPGPDQKLANGDTFVAAGMTEASGQTVPELTFAEDESHQLYVIDREVEVIHSESHVLCGCGPIYGGAMMRRIFGYRIPKERIYKGHVKVKVKWKTVDVRFDGREPNGGPCMMPPSMMSGPSRLPGPSGLPSGIPPR